jgi:hypothetical protein
MITATMRYRSKCWEPDWMACRNLNLRSVLDTCPDNIHNSRTYSLCRNISAAPEIPLADPKRRKSDQCRSHILPSSEVNGFTWLYKEKDQTISQHRLNMLPSRANGRSDEGLTFPARSPSLIDRSHIVPIDISAGRSCCTSTEGAKSHERQVRRLTSWDKSVRYLFASV